jgi:hypothetical protein
LPESERTNYPIGLIPGSADYWTAGVCRRDIRRPSRTGGGATRSYLCWAAVAEHRHAEGGVASTAGVAPSKLFRFALGPAGPANCARHNESSTPLHADWAIGRLLEFCGPQRRKGRAMSSLRPRGPGRSGPPAAGPRWPAARGPAPPPETTAGGYLAEPGSPPRP